MGSFVWEYGWLGVLKFLGFFAEFPFFQGVQWWFQRCWNFLCLKTNVQPIPPQSFTYLLKILPSQKGKDHLPVPSIFFQGRAIKLRRGGKDLRISFFGQKFRETPLRPAISGGRLTSHKKGCSSLPSKGKGRINLCRLVFEDGPLPGYEWKLGSPFAFFWSGNGPPTFTDGPHFVGDIWKWFTQIG